ncbi:hypothetical protein [Streptomyces sp. H34-S4]|uniref:hypothetical protein n=1 Tax=Streptomyces sp. H34-S4 TaxID=2996463 RepID=UPI00226F0416|nr:hypothetical protein [Streptomyces sp. H34-S4]MCY0933848.1 hypothetical protein [Streptomyces sp. H34-S4]
MSDLGRLAKTASEATVRIASATTLAAEGRRLGREPLPAWKTALLHQDLADATTLLQRAVVICHSAADFTRLATTAPESAAPTGQKLPTSTEQGQTGLPATPLTPAQREALRLIHKATVTLSQLPREHPTTQARGPEGLVTRSVSVSIPEEQRHATGEAGAFPGEITAQAVDQLVEMGLVQRDTRRSLFVGQRLHTTAAGRRTLDRFGPAPALPPPSAPLPGLPRVR